MRAVAGDVLAAYRSILAGQGHGLASCVADDAFSGIPRHEGSGFEHLAEVLGRARGRGLRTWSEDSADVLVSDFHAVVLDRWLATDDAGEIDQHITVVFADRRDDGRFGLVSIYGYDTEEFQRFVDA